MQYHRDLWGVTSFFNKTFSIATIMVSVLTWWNTILPIGILI
jgi:hypothetical protein